MSYAYLHIYIISNICIFTRMYVYIYSTVDSPPLPPADRQDLFIAT
jgi:hypothetical protein